MILHIDMDAFFASIETAINPRLKGRPLIVGSRGNRMHTVVCAASYEAKRLGIDSGMSTKEAYQICPDLVFVSAEQGKYIWTSEQIYELLKSYGFEVIYNSIDEFQMDIGQYKDLSNLAKSIQKHIQDSFNITASIGIAKNYMLAKLASKINKPNGVAIIDSQNLVSILGQTPAKRLCGVGPSLDNILSNLGIRTCLNLYQKSPSFLQKHLGQNGLNLYQSLHSTEIFDICLDNEKPKSVGHSYTFPRASQTPGFIKAWIRLLSEMVARRLRAKKLVSNTVHIWLGSPESVQIASQQSFQQSTDDGYEIYLRCLKIGQKMGLKKSQPWPKIRALGVTCSSLSQASYLPLFIEQKKREGVLKAVDQINDRHGEDTIYPAVITLTRRLPDQVRQ